MDRNLRLQVLLSAVDRVTAPLRKITAQSKQLTQALKSTHDQKRALEQTQKAATGYAKTQQSLRDTQQRLINAREQVRTMRAQLRAGEGDTDKFRVAFTKANLAVRDLAERSRNQRASLHSHRQALRDAGFDTSKFSQSQQQLRGNLAAVNDRIRQQRDQLNQAGRAAQQYARRQAALKSLHGKGMSAMGHGMGAAFLGERATRGVFNVIQPGVDFGEQMSELRAVSRLSEDDELFKKLRDQARLLGGTTAFTAHDAGAGQTFLARAGFSPEAILTSMGDVLDLALGAKLDLGRTADITSNISSAFKIDPEVEGSIKRVADVLSATSTRTNVDLGMLGESMKYLGQAEGLNVTLEQSAALAGLLGNIGIQGSQAGTTLRAMLNRLSGAIGAGKKAIEEIGLQVEDSAGNMRPITDLLDEIYNKTASMGNVKRSSLLKQIFGEEAGSGMSELISQQGSGAIGELIKQLKGSAGEAAQAARIMENNIGGDLKNLESSWEDLGITITNVNEGPLRDSIKSLNEIVASVTKWVQENPALAGSIAKWAAVGLIVISVLGGLAVVIGSLMIIFSGIAKTILGTWAVFSKIKPVLMGIGIVAKIGFLPFLLIIALIAGAAYLIWKNWDWLKAQFDGWWADTKAAWEGGWSSFLPHVVKTLAAIGKVLIDWSPIGLLHTHLFQPLMKMFGIDLPDKFSEFGSLMVNNLIDSFKGLPMQLAKAIPGMGAVLGLADELGFLGDTETVQIGLSPEARSTIMQGVKAIPGVGGAWALADQLGTGRRTTDIPLDSRPPVVMRRPVTVGGDTIAINITTVPGADDTSLAQQIQRALDDRDRQKQARMRGLLYDN